MTTLRVKGGYGIGGSYEIETDDGQMEKSDLHVMAVSGTIILNCAYSDRSYSESSGDDLTYLNGYQVNEQFGLGVDIKYQSYSFDFTRDLGMRVDETFLSCGLSSNYRF